MPQMSLDALLPLCVRVRVLVAAKRVNSESDRDEGMPLAVMGPEARRLSSIAS